MKVLNAPDEDQSLQQMLVAFYARAAKGDSSYEKGVWSVKHHGCRGVTTFDMNLKPMNIGCNRDCSKR